MARSQRTAGYLLLAAAAAALLQLSSAAAFRCPSKIDARRPLPTRVALSYGSTPPRFLFQPQLLLFMSSDKDNDDDDDAASNNLPGMSEAFRQLESLDSLFDPEEYIPAPDKIDVEAVLDREASTLLQGAKAVEVAPEQDFAVYRNMMEELEQNEDAEAYAELLDELGNSSLQTDDTYSQVLTELGGTRPAAVGTKTASNKVDATPSILSSDASKEQFMEEALQEALKEVKVNNPRLTDSILDNKEIMREIESIFDQGNEKLIASLEEIRIEQQELAAASAAAGAEAAVHNLQEDAIRLKNAERSMEAMLNRVNAETAEVERAVTDLKAASDEIDKNFMLKLKRGGLPKQGALAGFLLFAVRSLVDSVAAVSGGGDESHLTAALIQGVIAMVCAAIFFFL